MPKQIWTQSGLLGGAWNRANTGFSAGSGHPKGEASAVLETAGCSEVQVYLGTLSEAGSLGEPSVTFPMYQCISVSIYIFMLLFKNFSFQL